MIDIAEEIQNLSVIQVNYSDYLGKGVNRFIYKYSLKNHTLVVKIYKNKEEAEEEKNILTKNCPGIVPYYGMKQLQIEQIKFVYIYYLELLGLEDNKELFQDMCCFLKNANVQLYKEKKKQLEIKKRRKNITKTKLLEKRHIKLTQPQEANSVSHLYIPSFKNFAKKKAFQRKVNRIEKIPLKHIIKKDFKPQNNKVFIFQIIFTQGGQKSRFDQIEKEMFPYFHQYKDQKISFKQLEQKSFEVAKQLESKGSIDKEQLQNFNKSPSKKGWIQRCMQRSEAKITKKVRQEQMSESIQTHQTIDYFMEQLLRFNSNDSQLENIFQKQIQEGNQSWDFLLPQISYESSQESDTNFLENFSQAEKNIKNLNQLIVS